jgi:Fic family protein
MKLPEKPINWAQTLHQEGDNVFKLFTDKKLYQKIREFNKKYLYWDELKYRVSDQTEQKYVWTLMKFLRSEKYDQISLKNLELNYILLPEINKHLHRFDKYLTGNIEIHSKTLGLDKRYVVSSLMEEAIASSIMEGAITTRKAAKEMLKQKRKPHNKSEQMVVNGYETMQMIVKRKDEKLSSEFLLDIQRNITRETLDDSSHVGTFRDNNDIIVGNIDSSIIYHTPPSYKDINDLIEEVCAFANNDEEFIHPIIKGIILHFMIGYIHPFNDGNGRTARSVFYWYVLSRGYWLFEYMAVSRRILKSKKNYGLSYLFTEYDEMDLTYFIKYNAEAIEDALNDLLGYITSKQTEHIEAQKIIEKIKGLNFRQAYILEEIMKNPEKSYTIQEISETYHVVYQTARTDLLFLKRKGYLTMKQISKKFIFQYHLESKNNLK